VSATKNQPKPTKPAPQVIAIGHAKGFGEVKQQQQQPKKD
jgi:hypothetical protein